MCHGRGQGIALVKQRFGIIGTGNALAIFCHLNKTGIHLCPLRWCEAAERQSTARLPQGQKRLDRIAEPGIDLLDLRAQIGKILRGLLGEMGHIGIDLVDIAQTWRPRDPQAPHAVIQARQIIGRALRAGCHVVTIRLADDRERARRILDCARQRADMGHSSA